MSLGAPELSTKKYWEERYAGEDREGYDWFKKYADISNFLLKHIRATSRILILGCGTSSLSADLYDAGFKSVTSIDFSTEAISVMSRKNIGRPGMSFDVMDIRDLKYDEETFDVAIDKGTMDAMLCYTGSPWDPPEEVKNNCRQEISEAARVLVPGGVFLMISFRPSHFLRPRIQCDQWVTEPIVEQIGDFYYTVSAQKK